MIKRRLGIALLYMAAAVHSLKPTSILSIPEPEPDDLEFRQVDDRSDPKTVSFIVKDGAQTVGNVAASCNEKNQFARSEIYSERPGISRVVTELALPAPLASEDGSFYTSAIISRLVARPHSDTLSTKTSSAALAEVRRDNDSGNSSLFSMSGGFFQSQFCTADNTPKIQEIKSVFRSLLSDQRDNDSRIKMPRNIPLTRHRNPVPLQTWPFMEGPTRSEIEYSAKQRRLNLNSARKTL